MLIMNLQLQPDGPYRPVIGPCAPKWANIGPKMVQKRFKMRPRFVPKGSGGFPKAKKPSWVLEVPKMASKCLQKHSKMTKDPC